MIGYVLLITVVVIMGAIVYAWLKTYVPKDLSECPDGTSISLKDIQYDCANTLSLTLKNNGRFNISGYFIYATNNSLDELATIDLSPYNPNGENGVIIFQGPFGVAPKEPGREWIDTFNLSITPSFPGQIYSIEIMAMRYQSEDGKKKFVSCSKSKIKQEVSCS